MESVLKSSLAWGGGYRRSTQGLGMLWSHGVVCITGYNNNSLTLPEDERGSAAAASRNEVYAATK